jgi:hypothetical protein
VGKKEERGRRKERAMNQKETLIAKISLETLCSASMTFPKLPLPSTCRVTHVEQAVMKIGVRENLDVVKVFGLDRRPLWRGRWRARRSKVRGLGR